MPLTMVRNRLSVSLATLALIACIFVLRIAHADIPIPNLTSPVIDAGNFFSDHDEQILTQKIRTLFERSGPQMQIWTVLTLEGEPIESTTIRAVDAWKLGRSGKDDGLLLMLARQERRFRLEVGRGLEGTIPDALAGRWLRTLLVPALRRNEASTGVTLIISEVARLTLAEALQNDLREQPSNHAVKPTSGFSMLTIFLLLIAFVILKGFAGLAQGRPRGWHGRRGGWYGSSSTGRWSGGGGGGWSGGGGGFSGGGASGGW